jgi:hypothetical protein
MAFMGISRQRTFGRGFNPCEFRSCFETG